MADLRLTGVGPAALPPPARPSGAARDAQRAFFNAALANVQAPAAATRTPTEPPAATLRPSAAPAAAEAPVGRTPRPGSLLDIRV
ncbi:hypothetical protein BH09PSE2_BH09PSE2_00740 [soil metagenome]